MVGCRPVTVRCEYAERLGTSRRRSRADPICLLHWAVRRGGTLRQPIPVNIKLLLDNLPFVLHRISAKTLLSHRFCQPYSGLQEKLREKQRGWWWRRRRWGLMRNELNRRNGMSERSVDRWWQKSTAWLRSSMLLVDKTFCWRWYVNVSDCEWVVRFEEQFLLNRVGLESTFINSASWLNGLWHCHIMLHKKPLPNYGSMYVLGCFFVHLLTAVLRNKYSSIYDM